MHRTLLFIVLMALMPSLMKGQALSHGFYWFDADTKPKAAQLTGDLAFQFNADINELAPGPHMLYLQVCDTSGIYTAPMHRFIYKAHESIKVAGLQYWFETDAAPRASVPVADNTFLFNADISDLPEGLHLLYIQTRDEAGIYTAPLNRHIYKAHETPKVTEMQYWFDTDTVPRASVPVADNTFLFNADISELAPGPHMLYLQVCDTSGIYTAPMHRFIYKAHESIKVAGLQYWFETDAAPRASVPVADNTFLFNADISDLPEGLHLLYIQTRDEAGMYTAPLNRHIYKAHETPKVTEMQYWFDTDTVPRASVPVADNTFLFNADISELPAGLHLLYIQPKDETGIHTAPLHRLVYAKPQLPSIAKSIRYWFDDNTADFHDMTFAGGTHVIDVNGLSDGEHTVSFTIVDYNGKTTLFQTATFIKEDVDIRILVVRRHYTDEEIAKAQQNPNILVVKWENGEELPLSIRNGKNPNLITYVDKDTEIEGGFENSTNVVKDGVANRLELTDRTPLLIPEPFVASQAQYMRRFYKETVVGESTGWEAIALPYDVQDITAADGRSLKPFCSNNPASTNFWLKQMGETEFVDADAIRANVPYVIAMPNSTQYIGMFNVEGDVFFTSTNVDVHKTEEEPSEDAVFLPTYETISDYSDIYAVNDDAYTPYRPGSVFVQGLREVRPFEGYLVKDFNTSSSSPRRVILIGNGNASGIEEIHNSQFIIHNYYNLAGQRVDGSAKGIIIRNGRKVVR